MQDWFMTKLPSLSRGASKPSAESPGSSTLKHLEQGKARTSLIPETDKTLSKTNSLEAGLKALKSSSHPQSLLFLQALESPIQIVNDLLAENLQLQKELNNSHSHQKDLQNEIKWLRQELQKRKGSKGISEYYLVAENQRLQQELQELKNTQETLLSGLWAEKQELQQQLEELRKELVPENETIAEETSVPQPIAFPVQVRISGKTGGYEKQLLGDVTKVLAGLSISLQVEEYQEDSGYLLLQFSSIYSREITDIDNALFGLKCMQKVLLVVLHHESKSNAKFFGGTKPQVQHPALVGTVHAYFSMEDGFYHCQANKDAVESVANSILQFI